MADEIMTSQPVDDTTAALTKALVSFLAGPKVSALLANVGIQVDPTLLSVVIVGLLHKLHLTLKQETGWSWL